MESMKLFINLNRGVLTEFSLNFFQSIASAKNLKNLPMFMRDCVSCGVALAFREVNLISILF